MSEPFTGFGPRALGFFKALAFHQSKAWLDENRAIYEAEVRQPKVALLGELSRRFATAGIPLEGDARGIFRLNRDVRFSRDRHPYKTHGGAVMSRDGSRRAAGLLYLHVDPAGCFLAAGFWQPEPDQLARLRRAVVADAAGFAAVLAALADRGLALDAEAAMKRLPRGFEGHKGAAHEPALRLRSLVTHRPVADAAILEPDFVDAAEAFARDALPLLRWGWAALDHTS
jgi:uncharacterized protein (TIGR02453 family)